MRRARTVAGAVLAGALALGFHGGPLGANVVEHPEDVPDGTPGNPAVPTPSDAMAVVSMLENNDVDAFAVCVTDPATLHLKVAGTGDSATRLDTVMWLFDASGMLVATNDDRAADDRGSEIVPGTAFTAPGLHFVAVGYFRTKPYGTDVTTSLAPGQGPLQSWDPGFGVAFGHYQLDLLAGAAGSEACSGQHAVLTGNGRCQELGGPGESGRAHGLDRAADRRANATC